MHVDSRGEHQHVSLDQHYSESSFSGNHVSMQQVSVNLTRESSVAITMLFAACAFSYLDLAPFFHRLCVQSVHLAILDSP
jgi:hypothetical protein